MGLGVLGGGVATAKWLLKQGALLTVTDMKDEQALAPSLLKIEEFAKEIKSQIKYVLGGHEMQDFLDSEIIVINPDVPTDNPFVNAAREAGKQIENELTLFYKFAKFKTSIGVTGTRGKTTTTNWIGHIIKSAAMNVRVLGNDPEKPFLSEIENCDQDTIAVIETPSFQLEMFDSSGKAPHIAVITNLYQDHLSRHKTMEGYALAKANIFKNQTENDFLILNKENKWTEFFLSQNPKAKVVFSSDAKIGGLNREEFSDKFGEHNLNNFIVAAAACTSLGVSEDDILRAVEGLPQIKWREELVYDKGGLKIYNDTAATSPEALISAVERFSKKEANTIFIAGGTDKGLDFKEWGKFVEANLTPDRLVLLAGSATEKMKESLSWQNVNEFQSLEECFDFAIGKVGHGGVIVFSPGAKSFEKFKNEFDRGEKFNDIVKTKLA